MYIDQYKDWHIVTVTLRVTNPKFDDIHAWCIDKFGSRRGGIHANWDWGSSYGYSSWFGFKHKEDYTLFLLTWSEYVKAL